MDRRTFLGASLGAIALAPFTPGVGAWMVAHTAHAAEGGGIPGRKDKVVRTEAQWREALSPDQFRILREQGTERAFTGPNWDNTADGYYLCAGCDLPLYDSRTKYKSGTGWPSFWDAIGTDHVAERDDSSWFMRRTELVCNRCGGHLGHVFSDGPPPTGRRHCINGHAMRFVPIAALAGKKLDLPKGYTRPGTPTQEPSR